MSFTIEKNVPLPSGAQRRRSTYPFQSMHVGDSFVAKDDRSLKAALTASYRWKRRHDPDAHFCVSLDQLRIWRTA